MLYRDNAKTLDIVELPRQNHDAKEGTVEWNEIGLLSYHQNTCLLESTSASGMAHNRVPILLLSLLKSQRTSSGTCHLRFIMQLHDTLHQDTLVDIQTFLSLTISECPTELTVPTAS